MATVTLARDIGGTIQQPSSMHTVGLAQAGDSLLPHDFYDTEVQPVQAGNRYCIAAWVGTASCRAYLFISFHDAAGGFLGGVLSAVIPDGVPGGTDLSSWTRAFVFGTAPAGAATLRFNVRQVPVSGATSALTRLLRPTIEQALPGQTQPSMWAESANGMRAAFREATDAIATDVHAQSTAIQQLSARLDNGGDVHNALVQVTALAESTASAASGSWGVVVDADGKLAGIKALSDGRTSQIVMSADQVLIDGTLTARKIAAGAISTDKLQAGAVSADKIAVTALSAISAALGAITSAVIELVSAGWSYIRTYSKWFADGVDGFITAARHDTGDYFQEFRATNGNALILEQKSNGPNVGWRYYLQVRDGAGVDRMVIDPSTGSYKFKGTIYADAGTFAGTLQAATGTFSGVLTSNAINAVSRINIAGEQITVPRSVSGMRMVYSPASLADGEEIPCVITASCILPITLALSQDSITTDPGSSGDGGTGE